VKITKSRMKQIIKEEIQKALTEQDKKFFPTKKKCPWVVLPKYHTGQPPHCSGIRLPLKPRKAEGWEKHCPPTNPKCDKFDLGAKAPTYKKKTYQSQCWTIVDHKTDDPELKMKRMDTLDFRDWLSKNNCMRPRHITIWRLYGMPNDSQAINNCWANVSSYYREDLKKPEEEEKDEQVVEPSEEITFSDEEGSLGGGGGSGGCGPRPPLSKNWREKPMGSPEREAFRAWRECVRNAKSK